MAFLSVIYKEISFIELMCATFNGFSFSGFIYFNHLCSFVHF